VWVFQSSKPTENRIDDSIHAFDAGEDDHGPGAAMATTARMVARVKNFLTVFSWTFPFDIAGSQIVCQKRRRNTHPMNYSLRRVRRALKCEKILWMCEGQPSGDFEMWVPHPCAVCKGAVFWIHEPGRFLGLFYKRK
jgi:hypothetical protein